MSATVILRVPVVDAGGRTKGHRVVAIEATPDLSVLVGLASQEPANGTITIDGASRRFALDKAIGLAEAVLAGHPDAVTRPTAAMELAAVVMVLYGTLTRDDIAALVTDVLVGPAKPT